MTKPTHNLHIFFSGNDKALYASVAAVLKQLQVLEQLWQYADQVKVPQLKFHFHDTAAKDFDLNHNLASEIITYCSTVVTLISPDVFLGKNMVNSDARNLINSRDEEKLLLGIYCEKVVCRPAVLTLSGNRNWITASSTGHHLSTGRVINDEAADAVESLRKILEERLLLKKQEA